MIESRQMALLNKNTFLKEKMIISTDNYKLSLRKQKIENYLLLKRNIHKTNLTHRSTPINFSQIPLEAIASLSPYDNNTLTQLIEKCTLIAQRINKYLNSPSTLNYLLKELCTILELIPVESMPLISTTKAIDSLHAVISKHQANSSLINLVITAFIRCSMSTDKDFIEKFISVPFLQNYISLLISLFSLQSTELASHFILFLSNLVGENYFIQEIFYKYHIFDIIAEKLSEDLLEADLKVSITFFACFASFKAFPCLDCVLKLQSIFAYFLHKAHCDLLSGLSVRFNEDMLHTCMWGLSFVYFHTENDLLSEDNFDASIMDNVIDSCHYLNKGHHLVLCILGNITSRSDDSIWDRIYNEKTADFIIECLKDSDKQNQIKSMWVTSNLAIGSKLRCLFQFEFYYRILQVVKEESDHNVLFEFIQFIINCLSNYSDDSLVDYDRIFNEDLLCILFNMMTQQHCNQMLIALFDTLCSFNIEAIINRLKNLGVKDFLEKCIQMSNEEIQIQSSKLLDRYFKDLH